jgi:hypothetical protein
MKYVKGGQIRSTQKKQTKILLNKWDGRRLSGNFLAASVFYIVGTSSFKFVPEDGCKSQPLKRNNFYKFRFLNINEE